MQNSSALIDIIMVAMNNLKDLKTTIQSTRSFQSENVRLVIVDSSTTKELRQYCLELQQIHSNICYVWEEALGIYHAMNTGIRIARPNAYLWFLNPGDVLIDDSVASDLGDALYVNELPWGYALAAYMDSHGNTGLPFPQEITNSTAKLFSGQLMISHQSMFVKKELLLQIGGFDERFQIASDLDLQFKLLSMAEPLVQNRLMIGVDVTGISHQKYLRTLIESFWVRLSREEFSVRQCLKWVILTALKRLYNKLKVTS